VRRPLKNDQYFSSTKTREKNLSVSCNKLSADMP